MPERTTFRTAGGDEVSLRSIRCHELEHWLADGQPCTLLDVRTDGEWRAQRIPGAVLVPLHELEARLDEVLALPGPLVVYCAHGIRSRDAALYLTALGRSDVLNVVEGLAAWRGQTEFGSPPAGSG